MKRILLCAAIAMNTLTAFSQNAKMNFDLHKKLRSTPSSTKEIAVFVKGKIDVIKSNTIRLGGVYKYSTGDISAIRIPLDKIAELSKVADIQRIESNEYKLQPLSDRAVIQNHVLEVQNGFGLPQSYDGTGVVMGIIDEGIDYTHPDFRDQNGNTRIKYLWDQSQININPNTQPQPYGYGKEYVGSQIDTATQHYDSPFGHGTHVAGIACGNGLAVNNYKGMAPKADMIVVKANLHQPENDFLSSLVDAVKYIFDRADQMGQPAVINISLGTYFGSHDGKDIQAQSIDNLISASPGHVIVCSAGNAGTAPLHLGYNLSSDEKFTWLQNSNGSIYIEAWGDSGQIENAEFAIGIDRIKPDFHQLASLPLTPITSQLDTFVVDTIYSGQNRLGIVSRLSQNFGSRYSIAYQIVPDSSMNISGTDTSRYFWSFKTRGSGRMDAWSLDMVFDNLPDSTIFSPISGYKKPDTEQTIVSSFSCSEKVITVGSYINRNSYTNANFTITRDTSLTPGSISLFSSNGPTRDGRIKPDITATGEWLLAAGTQSELSILSATEPAKVAAGKKHKRSSGTSMSSPVVAGIAALYLQKNPTATWQEVKEAIINCADRDGFTGSALPDNKWGYGKVNAYAAVKGCTIGIDELTDAQFSLYPNPATDRVTVYLDKALFTNQNVQIDVLTSFGQNVKTIIADNHGHLEIETSGLSRGIYFITLKSGSNVLRTRKLVIL